MNNNQNKKGFTLIELMMVISVISLLSTVVMYRTSDARQKADDAHMKVEVREVEKAITLFKDDHGGKAPFAGAGGIVEGEMVLEGDPTTGSVYNDSMALLVPKYLPAIPTSPSGNRYSYMVTEDRNNAVFAANLNNEPSGGGNSNNNSCDFIVAGGFDSWGSTCFPNDGASCSSATYDKDQYVCFDGGDVASSCSVTSPPECTGYSVGDSAPDVLCQSVVNVDYDGPTGNINCQISAPYDYYLCEYNGTTPVCSGGSNADYCTCI